MERLLHKLNCNILKLYWKTLRINKRTGWGLSRGASINTVLTTKCNQTCVECPMFIYGEVKRYKESTFEEWKTFYERFPMWISQIYLSGGEPSLYPDIVKLTNWLIERGHHVCIFSNLWKVENFKGIKPHWRLVVHATYHSCDNWERYCEAFKTLSKQIRVLGREFEDVGGHPIKQDKKFTLEWFKNTDCTIHFPPDAPRSLKLYVGCVELYRDIK